MIAAQARTNAAVSVLVFDLDHFKSINDRFGHGVGDDALRTFATTARNNVRATDVLARLGGEEFAIILPGGAADATMVGERLRAAFQAAAVEVSGHSLAATVSVGIATALAPATIEHLVERADVALYRAKSKGRNRIELAASEPVLGHAAAAPRPRTAFRAAIAHWNLAPIWSANGTFYRG